MGKILVLEEAHKEDWFFSKDKVWMTDLVDRMKNGLKTVKPGDIVECDEDEWDRIGFEVKEILENSDTDYHTIQIKIPINKRK